MKAIVTAAIAALVFGVAAPVTSASAFSHRAPVERPLTVSPYDDITTGSLGFQNRDTYGACAPSSASEGNANQQTRSVMQYGQTSGGGRC
ncbi:hypothetical protein [Methylobacterium marchantiae]|uniref:Uncharacterized protein n=1 Tax=Methylobacterium marchantiae TaxID=600331 RepID=A0ABW3WYK3_9HYPH|nr:hypothetical protein AIGOOFII_3124 [Methylobacterium marchantiae]